MMRFAQKLTALLILMLLLASCGSGKRDGEPLPWLPVREGRNYGFINTKGQKEISTQFAYALPFSVRGRDSVAWAGVNVGGQASHYNMPADGKWGFINSSGRFEINPKYLPPPVAAQPFDRVEMGLAMHEAYRFSEGLAAVRIEGEWIYIDKDENVVIRNPKFRSPRRFREGLANVMIGEYWGYIDRSGAVVIEPDYRFPADFVEGYAYVVPKKGEAFIINREGEQILKQYRPTTGFKNGMAVILGGFSGDLAAIKNKDKLGIIDTEGFVRVQPQFDEAGAFGSGLCPVRVGSRPLSESRPRLATERHEGGKWGYVNSDGVFQINPIYDGAKRFSGGFAAVKSGRYWGYINSRGKRIAKPVFRWAGEFDPDLGVAIVQLGPSENDFDHFYGYINRDGEVFYTMKD